MLGCRLAQSRYILCSGDNDTEPESNIARLLDAIDSLTDAARAILQRCSTREFNVGYDCGDQPWAFNQGLSNDTLRRMAALNTPVANPWAKAKTASFSLNPAIAAIPPKITGCKQLNFPWAASCWSWINRSSCHVWLATINKARPLCRWVARFLAIAVCTNNA